MIEKMNAAIHARTSYGLREEVAEANGYILNWSNAGRAWVPTYGVKRGETVTLDANQVLAYGSRKAVITAITSGKLAVLPLFANSAEAKFGGAF